MKPLVECSRCKNGIGIVTYKSNNLNGEYCTMDCYVDTMIDEHFPDGLKGKYNLVSDKHGGVELEAILSKT